MEKRLILVLALLVLVGGRVGAQNISVTAATGQNINDFVQNNLIGNGVYVFNVKFNNATGNIATPQIGTFNSNNYVQLFMDQGVVMTTGNVNVAPGPNSSGSHSNAVSPMYSDQQLSSIASGSINGCATLDFDFVSISPFVTVNYCFGSEEYPEYVCSSFNDVFAFLVTGPSPTTGQTVTRNAAIIPHSTSAANPNGIAVAINTVNVGQPGGSGGASGCIYNYTQYYVTNSWNTGVQYDGFTRKLAASTIVVPCQQYHMHISVCNVGDNAYDSGVFLEHNSFNSPVAQINLGSGSIDTIQHSHPHTVPITVAGSEYDYGNVHIAFGGQAVYGVHYLCIAGTNDTLWPGHSNVNISSPNQHITLVGRPGVVFNEPMSAELYLETSLCEDFPALVTRDTLRYVFIEDDIVLLRDTTIEAVDTCKMVGVEVEYAARPQTLSFQWIPEDGIDHPRQQYSTALITENTDYVVIAVDDIGNADTAQVHVVVRPNAIEEMPAPIPVNIYPNPVNHQLTVEVEGLQRIELVSPDGVVVYSSRCTDGRAQVDVTPFAAGVYSLCIVVDGGTITEKIVVK